MKKQQRGVHWMIAYTALFAVCFAVCYWGLLAAGKTNIWMTDGLMQHYPFMVYIGQWIRDSLKAVLSGGALKMFDFSLGFGEDVISAVNYYGFGDPLMLLAALFSGESTELFYFLLTVLKVWAAGAVCGVLARHYGMNGRQAVWSGLIYAFSLNLLTGAITRHAMFANPYVHLPLMLLGLEYVFEKRRSWMLSVAVMLSALCGFYFLFTNSLLMLAYAVVRQFTRGEEHPVRTLPATAARAIGWYVLGIGLAAAIFLPSVYGFLNGQRLAGVGNGAVARLRYSWSTYTRFPLAMISGVSAGPMQFMPVMTMLGIAAMIAGRRKEDRGWLAMLAVLLAMTAVPAVGWILNGFSYETTRWSYGISLMFALVGGWSLKALLEAKGLGRWMVTLFAALIGAYMLLKRWTDANAWLALAGSLAAVWMYWLLAEKSGWAKRAAAVLLAAVVAANVISVYRSTLNSQLWEQIAWGESYGLQENSPYVGLGDAEGRVDSEIPTVGAGMNLAMLEGAASTAVYNSTIDGSYYQFMLDVASPGLLQINSIVGLDGRAALEALWGTEYYVCDEEWSGRVPYGFEPVESANDRRLFRNTLAMPIGYVLTGVMSAEDYAALSPLEKQWALLQCAVPEQAAGNVAETVPELCVGQITIEHVEMEDIEADGNVLTVGENGVIRLTFDAPAGCELYLQMNGLASLDGVPDLGNRVLFHSGCADTTIMLAPHGIQQDILRPYYLVNLGYDDEERTQAEIRFARTGRYLLGEMQLYAQPMEAFPEMIAQLQQRGMTDVVMETNRISGRVETDEPGVMVFSIPYSEGWTVRVDGAEVEATSSAGAFLAAEIEAGAHEIELTYRTPWLGAGCVLSAAALAVLAGAIFAGRRRKSAMKGA